MKILNNIKTCYILQVVEKQTFIELWPIWKGQSKNDCLFHCGSSRLNIFGVSSAIFSRQFFGHVVGAPRSLQLLHEKNILQLRFDIAKPSPRYLVYQSKVAGSGCFLKWWVFPPNHPLKNRVFHYKPSILGYPYFWKHPFAFGIWSFWAYSLSEFRPFPWCFLHQVDPVFFGATKMWNGQSRVVVVVTFLW